MKIIIIITIGAGNFDEILYCNSETADVRVL